MRKSSLSPPFTRPFESPDSASVFHLYVLLFDFDKIGKSRAVVMEELKKNGVGTTARSLTWS